MSDQYAPPYRISPSILHSIEQVGAALGKLRAHSDSAIVPILRRGDRIKTIHASLAIEEAALLSDQESDYQSDQVIRLLRALRKSQRGTSDLMIELGVTHRPTFRKNHLHLALKAGLIEMTQPDTPRARNQKYRLTGRGKQLMNKGKG